MFNLIKKIFNHAVFKNSVALGVIKVVDMLVPLLVIPYLTRVLSIEEMGIYMIMFSVITLAYIITNFGFSLSAPYKISINKHDINFIRNFITTVFTLKIFLFLLSLIAFVIYWLLNKDSMRINSVTIILVNLIVLLQTYQAPWIFLGIEDMKNITISNTTTKISYLFFIFILMPFNKSVNMVLFCLLLSNVLCTFVFYRLIKKQGFFWGKTSKVLLITELKESFSFFLARAATSISTSINNLIIGYFIGVAKAGLYGIAEKSYNIGMGLSDPITNALYPYMARTGNRKVLYKISALLFITAAIFCYGLSFFTPNVLALLFGEKYRISAEYLNLLLILVPINLISILFGYPAFASIGKPKIANYTVTASATFYLIILLCLIFNNNLSIFHIIYSMMFVDSLTLSCRLALFAYFKDKNLMSNAK